MDYRCKREFDRQQIGSGFCAEIRHKRVEFVDRQDLQPGGLFLGEPPQVVGHHYFLVDLQLDAQPVVGAMNTEDIVQQEVVLVSCVVGTFRLLDEQEKSPF